jgi:RHS repeat-associated protein
MATDNAGAVLWSGGFEPFGEDYSGAGAAGMPLRLPGQWSEPVWSGVAGLHENVYRWYMPSTGGYSSPDPLGLDPVLRKQGDDVYRYSLSSPIVYFDPLGLACRTRIETGPWLFSSHLATGVTPWLPLGQFVPPEDPPALSEPPPFTRPEWARTAPRSSHSSRRRTARGGFADLIEQLFERENCVWERWRVDTIQRRRLVVTYTSCDCGTTSSERDYEFGVFRDYFGRERRTTHGASLGGLVRRACPDPNTF